MKKVISLVLILALGTLMLAGCSGQKPAPASSSAPALSSAPATSSAPAASSAATPDWPKRAINFIGSHGAGGDTDLNGRMIAKYLEKELGVPVAFSNVTGGNGAIAYTQLKDTKPDGYTFVATNTAAFSANEASGLQDFGYDSFSPVSIFGRQSGETLIVRKDAPYNTVKELIEASKAKPNTIKLGISMGGAVYTAAIVLERNGAKLAIIDIGDGAARMTGLIGGHVDATIVPYLTAREYVEKGTVKPLCTLMAKRSAGMPDVPTAQEAGLSELVVNTLYAVFAPKGTDPAIVEKVNAAILKVVNENAEYRKMYKEMNFQDPWGLNVKDTIAELDAQRKHFGAFSQFLKK